MKNSRFFLLSLLIQQFLGAMDREEYQMPNFKIIAALPAELNYEIITRTTTHEGKYGLCGHAIRSLACTNKNNNSTINSPEGTQALVAMLEQKTKNKVRAYQLLKTKDAKRELKVFLATDEGKVSEKQAREEELLFIKEIGVTHQDQASKSENLEKIIEFVNDGINVNDIASDDFKSTPLHAAVSSGDTQKVDILLKTFGINVNDINVVKLTPLMVAVCRNNYEIIELLLQDPRVNVNAVGVWFWQGPMGPRDIWAVRATALQISRSSFSHTENTRITDLLIAHGAQDAQPLYKLMIGWLKLKLKRLDCCGKKKRE